MVNKANKAAKILGKRIKLFRRQRQWSQEKLAAEAGIDKAYLGRVERGETNVGIENISALAQALGVTIADLFTVERRPIGRRPAKSTDP